MLSRIFPFAAALPALVLSLSSLRAADGWVTDFEKAKAAAAKENKDLLMDFTGSDWCGWCIRLRKEVFDKDTFKKSAPKDFILVEIDFPRETKLSEELQKQNESLQEKYRIEGYPTIILADAEGRPYATASYEEGGAAHYLEVLADLRKKREVRDANLKKAAAATGVEKAKLIVEALKEMSPELVHTFYRKEVEEAIAADKDDTTGVKKSRDEFATEDEFKAKVNKVEEELAELHDKKKFPEFKARIDKFIADEKLTGQRKQELLMAKLAACEEDFPAMLKILDEVIAVDPTSEFSQNAVDLKDTVKQEMKKAEKGAKDGKKKKHDVEEPVEPEQSPPDKKTGPPSKAAPDGAPAFPPVEEDDAKAAKEKEDK